MAIQERTMQLNSKEIKVGVERAIANSLSRAEYFRQITSGLNTAMKPYGIIIMNDGYIEDPMIVTETMGSPGVGRKRTSFDNWSEAIRFAMSVYTERVVECVQKD